MNWKSAAMCSAALAFVLVFVPGCSGSSVTGTPVVASTSNVTTSKPSAPTSTPPQSSSEAPEPSTTSPPRPATYSSVVRLRDAAIAAGYACPSWVEDDAVTNASESGTCSDEDVFCVYASTAGRDAQIAQTRSNNDLLKESGLPISVVLFGPNWSINVPQVAADQLSQVLGGTEAK